MNRLANTIGSRIKEFDAHDVNTVGIFNHMFPECPIRDKDVKTQVIILGPESNNCRAILVGDEVIKHKMFSDLLYTIDKEEYFLDERETELNEINGVMI